MPPAAHFFTKKWVKKRLFIPGLYQGNHLQPFCGNGKVVDTFEFFNFPLKSSKKYFCPSKRTFLPFFFGKEIAMIIDYSGGKK